MQPLKNFLDLRKSEKGGDSNVTSLDGAWGGKWLISKEDYPKFLELYHNACVKADLRLVEKKQNYQEPYHMLADVDISDEDKQTYFPEGFPPYFLQSIIDNYVEAMESLVSEKVPKEHLKPIISCRSTVMSKIHLNWPYININNVRGKAIRDEALRLMKAKIPTGNWDKWLDSASYTKTGLRMLGSVKQTEKRDKRYYIISGFNENNSIMAMSMALTLEDICRTSIRVLEDNPVLVEFKVPIDNKIVVKIQQKQTAITKDNKDLCTADTDFPTDLSKLEESTISDQERIIVENAFKRAWATGCYPPEVSQSFSIGETKKKGQNYFMTNGEKIMCLFVNREHKRDSSCHYHTLCSKGTYLGCFDEGCLTKKYPDPPIPLPEDIRQVLYQNNGIIQTGNGKIIIHNKAETSLRLDFHNDLSFIQHYREASKDLILLKSLNAQHLHVATLLHLCAGDKFYYRKDCGWWYWDGVIWRNHGNEELIRTLCDDVNYLIEATYQLYIDNFENRKEIHDYDKKIKQILKFQAKLESRDYKQQIIGEAEWIFKTSNPLELMEVLDTNPWLIAFTNGVFDLKAMKFRPSLATDYISLTTGYDYEDINTIHLEDMSSLNSFMEAIMPNPDDRNYLLKFLSSGLVGINKSELFHIFTGAGRNGKSKLAELLDLTLGQYYETFSASFLTSKTGGPEQAAPQLMALRKARLVLGSEPDTAYKLNSNLIKSLSGNDKMTGRKLYGQQEKYKPNFKMILLCNNIPEIDSSDEATWRRFRCLNFPTKFVSNPTEPNERQIDETISQKLPRWRQPLLHLLLKYFEIYHNEGLEMTENMKSTTSEYQSDSDMYLKWLNERTEKADTAIHTCVLYDDFKCWHSRMYPGKKLPNHLEFVRGIKQYRQVKHSVRYNKVIKQGINDIRIKLDVSDDI
jgi:P4 family phage/plasmid primase-like protien